jgi:hypothetical protein
MLNQFELQFQGESKQFSTSVLDHREEFGELIANIFGIQFGYLQDKQGKVVSLRDVKPGHTYTAFPKVPPAAQGETSSSRISFFVHATNAFVFVT